jgi:hypothetical protein
LIFVDNSISPGIQVVLPQCLILSWCYIHLSEYGSKKFNRFPKYKELAAIMIWFFIIAQR